MPSSRYTIATTLFTILSTTPNITPAFAAHDNPTNGAAPAGELYYKSGSGCDHEATTTQFMTDLGANLKFATLEECCARSFNTDTTYDTCLEGSGGAILGSNKFYPSTGSNNYCVKDCDPRATGADTNCGGVLPTASKDVNTYADAAACCSARYQWINADYCAHMSTTPTVDYPGTNEYWLDSTESICYKNCKGGSECGGIATQTWQKLYTDLDACCTAMTWMEKSFCLAQTDPAVSATNEWFVKDNKCMKDCTGTGPECAAANRYNQLEPDSATCCSKSLGWQNQDFCKSRSDPNTHGFGGGAFTGKWFVDYGDNVCVKDCNTSGDQACDSSLKDSSMPLYDSAATCCSSKLGWIDSNLCETVSTTGAAAASTGTSKWYADYASTKRCVLDCKDSPLCGGIVPNTAGVGLYDDAAACCSAKFGWYNQELCVAISDGGGTGVTGKWYVQYGDNACVQDCPKGTGVSCGGTPSDLGMAMYESAASCCSTKLGWTNEEACVSKSINGADAPVVGTNKYHADWSGGKGQCGKDCKKSSTDPGCTGIISGGDWVDTLYDTAAACCSAKYNWVSPELCKMKSEGSNNGYTNWFYPKTGDNICVQDCAKGTGDKCDGSPSDMGVKMYETIESCCSTSIGWHPAAKCQQVSEADQATSEYWISWKENKCVKNCPTSQGGSCGGIAENWDQKYGSSSACCSQPAFAWKERKDCVK